MTKRPLRLEKAPELVIQLNKLREIAVAATDGPWNLHTLRTDETHDIRGSIDDEANIVIYAECEDADALHIATFDPPTVLELLDEIERLQRWKREAKQVFRGLGDLVEVADVPLGHSIIKGAIDCITELRKEIDNLQSTKEEA